MIIELNKEEIEKIIPHKGLAVMIDGIIYDTEMPDKITAFKTIAFDDIFLEGHFPNSPVYPGHFLDEWMCLAAIVLFKLKIAEEITGLPMVRGKENVKYKTAVKPGDFLAIYVSLKQNRNNKYLVFQGMIHNQRGELVASIEKITGVIA